MDCARSKNSVYLHVCCVLTDGSKNRKFSFSDKLEITDCRFCVLFRRDAKAESVLIRHGDLKRRRIYRLASHWTPIGLQARPWGSLVVGDEGSY